ncbi:chemotaxis protein CheW [Aestuariibacter sp. GS-14]|uniref:chemotaxis protein CheW n=1 Tax=Aestuariibacter sp. GS-14 TaxID=2590670 RepID=UPI001129E19F|nr:chemotaxis protein CheW [Aestuariibacter sp. GS-14]TPV57344.1 chemotaxis protein CheW [Aestuariibacter sp. GS-14]
MADQNNTVKSDAGGIPGATIQLLTFVLDDEIYGADINQIQEVLEYRRVTRVPRTPDYLLGVINLRGQVLPVVDLRHLFEMHRADMTVNTCIVIVEVSVDGENVALGILADAVREVIELPVSDINPPPRIGSRIDTKFISGMGKYHDEFIVILNLSKVMGDEDLGDVYEAVSATKDMADTVPASE